ncbi:MAG: Hpt domain-containing protein [Parvularculaceae bacterium]
MTAPIDLKHLDRYVCGDKALLDEVLGIFVDQARSITERMRPGVSDCDWRLAAHTLKGAARGVGAWRLGEAADRAEAATNSDERAHCVEEIVALASEAADYAASVTARAA